jgi:hypothetical protein
MGPSAQGLCAIGKVEFKVIKSTRNPHTAKLDRFENRKISVEFRRVRIPVLLTLGLVISNYTPSVARLFFHFF